MSGKYFFSMAERSAAAAEHVWELDVASKRYHFAPIVIDLSLRAIELSLKAILIDSGMTTAEVRKTFGHDLESLLEKVGLERGRQGKRSPMRFNAIWTSKGPDAPNKSLGYCVADMSCIYERAELRYPQGEQFKSWPPEVVVDLAANLIKKVRVEHFPE